MAAKDDHTIQRGRIERIAHELCPTCKVEWDPETVPTWIRFRVVDSSGTILAVSSGHQHVSELADKSDDWVRKFLKQISGGKL